MPGSVKVKVLTARNLPIMNRLSFLTDAFVEICIGNITHRTDVVKRSLNPSWNSDWYFFELDDQALQEEALLLNDIFRVMDHDTYSSHDTIGRVYFDLNPLLSCGHTRCLNGWFPIYDTMHGIRGEISLAIRVDVFLDASRYRQSSLGVQFFHCHTIPQGYNVEHFIGFIQELVMNEDPEHQWIEKIRTSRASNEARQRLFSRLSGELQRKLGLKVMNLGGNSVIGYQLHFDLEGETGVVVRGIGTAVRLRKMSLIQTPPNSPTGNLSYTSFCKSSSDRIDSLINLDTDHGTKMSQIDQPFMMNGHQPLELGEFPFLTISQPLPGMISSIGSIVSSKSVKLLDKNTPAGIQFRDAWWLELRIEIAAHMCSVNCDTVIAYREECAIYEDVCILTAYGTAVRLNSHWAHYKSVSIKNPFQTVQTLQKVKETIMGSITKVTELSSAVTNSKSKFCDISPSSNQPITADLSGWSAKICPLENIPMPNASNLYKISDLKLQTLNLDSDPPLVNKLSALNSTSTFPMTSTRCAICKAAQVPDLIFSSADFPPELHVIGNPALVQAHICRSKKDTKGEVSANELSELRGMNGLFGLRFHITIGEYMIAAIATGTGVFISALPAPPPPSVLQVSQVTTTPEDPLIRIHLQKQVDDYLLKSRRLFGTPDFNSMSNHNRNDSSSSKDDIATQLYKSSKDLDMKTNVHSTNSGVLDSIDDSCTANMRFDSDSSNKFVSDTMFMDSREPEPEELAVLLKDPLQPSGLILTTTESLPVQLHLPNCSPHIAADQELFDVQHVPFDPNRLTSFIRFHETEMTCADSFFENPIPLDLNPNTNKLLPNIGPPTNPPHHLSHPSGKQPSAFGLHPTPSTNSVLPQHLVDSSVCNAQSNTNMIHLINNRNPLMGNCLSKIMCEFNQLTWFRFRKYIPCVINALDYRLALTDDEHVQIIVTGMILVPLSHEDGDDMSQKSKLMPNCLSIPLITDPNKIGDRRLHRLSNQIGCEQSVCPGKNSVQSEHNENVKLFSGCLLTPLSTVPGAVVESYLGNFDFFFIRETTDLREDGGVCGFLHTSLTEVQAVVGAHTNSIGGNALLSYHLSEVLVLRPTSRNQAQCLLNVCGDMAQIQFEPNAKRCTK